MITFDPDGLNEMKSNSLREMSSRMTYLITLILL